MLDERVGHSIRSIQIEQQLVPLLHERYSNELAEKLGLIKPDEHRRVTEALQEIDKEEERTLRLFAAGRVTEEIWNNLWREWQDRRQKLLERQAILGRQQTYHVSNLDAALNLISKIGVLYDGLDLIQKKQLLREIVERVVVNAEGEILRIELLPPFIYLFISQTSRNKCKL